MLLVFVVLTTIPWLNVVHCFDQEEFLQLLCAANENNMAYIYKKCEVVLKDAVDGCIEKCFIEVRNKRAPQTRIDAKYYQFVLCDKFINQEFYQCVSPCVQQLKVSYNGMNNINEWVMCGIEMVRKMENTIEHQDNTKTKRKTKPSSNEQGTKRPSKVKSNNNGKGKASKAEPKVQLRLKINKNK